MSLDNEATFVTPGDEAGDQTRVDEFAQRGFRQRGRHAWLIEGRLFIVSRFMHGGISFWIPFSHEVLAYWKLLKRGLRKTRSSFYDERPRPEQTTLHHPMRQHAASFMAYGKAGASAELPRFVTDDFDYFLECGILALARTPAPKPRRSCRRSAVLSPKMGVAEGGQNSCARQIHGPGESPADASKLSSGRLTRRPRQSAFSTSTLRAKSVGEPTRTDTDNTLTTEVAGAGFAVCG